MALLDVIVNYLLVWLAVYGIFGFIMAMRSWVLFLVLFGAGTGLTLALHFLLGWI